MNAIEAIIEKEGITKRIIKNLFLYGVNHKNPTIAKELTKKMERFGLAVSKK